VLDNCLVDQVAYVVRHGSRYPDSGAYAQWVTLYQKVNPEFKVEREDFTDRKIDSSRTIHGNRRIELPSILETGSHEPNSADCSGKSYGLQGGV
jgi:hypothetical protein